MATDRNRDQDGRPPAKVRDNGEVATAKFVRENQAVNLFVDDAGAEDGHGYVTINPGDHVVGPDGEVRVTVDGISVWSIQGDEWAVELCVENEQGEVIPWAPDSFARAFLSDDDGGRYFVQDAEALSDDELERREFASVVERLESVAEGDRVLFNDRKNPLTVVDDGLTISSHIYVEGPKGGEYVLEWNDRIPRVRHGFPGGSIIARVSSFRVVESDGE